MGQADGQGWAGLSSSSAKHNLSLGRVPTLAHPATSVSHLPESGAGGFVGKSTMNAHINETMEYHAAKNMPEDSKVLLCPLINPIMMATPQFGGETVVI